MFIIYILSSLICRVFSLNIYAIIMALAGIIAGSIGRSSRSEFKVKRKKRGNPL